MQTFKRILAVIIMAISVLVLVVSLTGIVGAWIVRAQLTTDLVGLATEAEARASTIKRGLDLLDTTLTRARVQVAAVEQDVQTFGADVEENKPLLTAISDKLGIELSLLVDSAREIMTSIREAVAAVNSAIEAINAIPFVSVPTPGTEHPAKAVPGCGELSDRGPGSARGHRSEAERDHPGDGIDRHHAHVADWQHAR